MSNEKQSYLEKLETQFEELSLSYHRGVVDGKNYYETATLVQHIATLLTEIRLLKQELVQEKKKSFRFFPIWKRP